MELILDAIQHLVYFSVSSIPLITVFLHLKVFRLSPKETSFVVVLILFISVFFWVKEKDVFLILYQCVPYISSFIWLWTAHIMLKRQENSKSGNTGVQETGSAGDGLCEP